MIIAVNYITLGILLGVVALNLQLEFYYSDAFGPIFPRITSYIDVMTTAPFPLNSIILVTIALGVSNVILRAWDHGNAPDWLLCAMTAGGLATFISNIVAQQTYKELTLLHRADSGLPGLLSFLLALFYLLCMFYLSYLSSQAEKSAQPSPSSGKPLVNLDPVRKELEAMKKRFSFPPESPRNGRR